MAAHVRVREAGVDGLVHVDHVVAHVPSVRVVLQRQVGCDVEGPVLIEHCQL